MKEITITTPFSDKPYCLGEYKKSIENLDYPKELITYLIWDNSNNEVFEKEIQDWANSLGFKKVIYHKDEVQHTTIDNTTVYSRVASRVQFIYDTIAKMIPDNEYWLNIEDDISFETDALKKLVTVLEENREVASIGGTSFGRRMKDLDWGIPQVWGFTWAGTNDTYPSEKCYPLQAVLSVVAGKKPVGMGTRKPAGIEQCRIFRIPPKKFGWEVVGGTAFGFVLFRTKIAKELGFPPVKKVGGTDPYYGFRLWFEGKGVHAIHWGVKLNHWYKIDDIVGCSNWASFDEYFSKEIIDVPILERRKSSP